MCHLQGGGFSLSAPNRVLLNEVKQPGTMWQKQGASGPATTPNVGWAPLHLVSQHQPGPSSLRGSGILTPPMSAIGGSTLAHELVASSQFPSLLLGAPPGPSLYVSSNSW